MAIQDFMKTRKGREVVLAEFLMTLDSDKDLNITWYLRQLDETSRAAFGYYQKSGQAWHKTKSRTGSVGTTTPYDGPSLVSSIHSLLRSMNGQPVTLPEFDLVDLARKNGRGNFFGRQADQQEEDYG